MMPARQWNHSWEEMAKAPSVRLVLKVGKNEAFGEGLSSEDSSAKDRVTYATLPCPRLQQNTSMNWGVGQRSGFCTQRSEKGRWKPPSNKTLTSLTSGASEPWCTLTDAVIGGARSPVFTVAGQGAVGAPASLSAHAVTVDTWNKAHGQGWVRSRWGGRLGW